MTEIPPPLTPQEPAPLHLMALRLLGSERYYEVSFLDDDGNVKPLSIIAGEISTGKTSTLELIDYMLGNRVHPEHEEIIGAVSSAQLQLEVRELAPATSTNGPEDGAADEVVYEQVAVQHVLERFLNNPSAPITMYRGALSDSNARVRRRLSPDPAADNSLSQFLLSACGLAGLRLREAPTQADSKTSILSFRDLAPLWFLNHRRLDNGDLVYEHQPYRHLKLRQVVDYIFDVSDQVLSDLQVQIEEESRRLSTAKSGLTALENFVVEQGIPSQLALAAEYDAVTAQLVVAQEELARIDGDLREQTSFASQLRTTYEGAARAERARASELRERETLLRRLGPLRSQYADDVRKLGMLIEARRLFDPLSVRVCPACQSPLNPFPEIDNGTCTLCNQHAPHLSSDLTPHMPTTNGTTTNNEAQRGALAAGDLESERRSVNARLRELQAFMRQVETEAALLREQVRQAESTSRAAQLELDYATREAVTPYVAERDIRGREVQRLESALAGVRQRTQMIEGVEDRRVDIERLQGSLRALRDRRSGLESSRVDRDNVLSRFSRRFSEVLADFGFPKLSNAYLDKQLLPHARMQRYDRIGSSGAMTLMSLAWQLSIFELSVEEGRGHPGFLMIDSPQKNLMSPGQREWGEEEARSIVDKVYRHIYDWLASNNERAQIIIVDNQPPSWVFSDVVVRFSADPSNPPYGLIDDAIG